MPGGDKGVFHAPLIVCISGMCRARDPHFCPEFPFRSISFSQISKKIRSGASPFYIILADLPNSGDHHFKIS